VDAHAFDIGVINYPSGMSMLSPDVRRDRAHTRGLVRSSSWVRSSWERASCHVSKRKEKYGTDTSLRHRGDRYQSIRLPSLGGCPHSRRELEQCQQCLPWLRRAAPPPREGRPSSPAPNIHTPHTTRARARAQKPGARAGPTGAKGGAPRRGQRRCGPHRRCTRARSRKARAESEELVIRMDQEWL
jgi:hypothetical protein